LCLYCGLASGSQSTAGTYIVVAQDGSGDVKTITDAVKLIPSGSKDRYTIGIKPGFYYEKIYLYQSLGPVSFLGLSTDASKVILSHDDAATGNGTPGCKANSGGEWDSQTLMVESADAIFANMTVANNACNYNNAVAGQSFAVQILSDRVAFYNTALLGAQDTLYTGSYRTYYSGTRINGSVDSIFGESAAVFDNCLIEIYNHITADKGQQATLPDYLIQNSHLKAATGSKQNATELGRPWGQYARVIYKNTYMENHIVSYGWGDWGHNYTTAADSWCANVFYAEYNSTGPGANPTARVPWSHQLTASQAEQFTVSTVLSGWTPPPPPQPPTN